MLDILAISFVEPCIVLLSNGLYFELSELTAEHWIYDRLTLAAKDRLDHLRNRVFKVEHKIPIVHG